MPKRVLPLSVLTIENAKSKNKAYKLVDGFGLYVLVTPTGGKLWRMQYRFSLKQKVLAFGAYPIVSLADAREKRTEAQKLLAKGLDPSRVKKEEKEAKLVKHANSFEVVARDWFNRFKSSLWTEKNGARKLHSLEKDVFPVIGQRPIGEIKAPEVLEVLRRIEKRSLEQAHKAKFTCGQVFRYAVVTGVADRDPVADLSGALPAFKNKHYAAPTDPKDVAPLMRALDGYEGTFVVRCALKLAPPFLCQARGVAPG